ncbi:hypothetical protein AAF712_014442 [Marasmius tenuissimus]|uniref:Alpha-L-arabinofuranosidase 1 catalytic domain-containing protein n=1 Tax=Marasmius tenuissimus TaxID=585030 RepID=A0ABR2ZD83_9AGAR
MKFCSAPRVVSPGTSQSLTAWSAVNGAQISVVNDGVPVSSALPNSLNLVVPGGKSGGVGVRNSGWWGIKVTSGSEYIASFFYKFPSASPFNGPATISLQTSSGQILGSATVSLAGSQTSWKQVTAKFKPTTTPGSTDNYFAITVDGAAASGQTIRFALFSLFPPTFKNRPNGMRQDIAQALADMSPGVFRFPGGNNLVRSMTFLREFFIDANLHLELLKEGQTTDRRWQWRKTVGPLESRPGRQGDWSYVNTDGLGLYEYFLWCEDIGAEPIMGIWARYSLGGTSVPTNQLQPYVQEAADQINFAIGDPTKSAAAALRSQLGHPAPFKLTHVEVGNEDFIGNAAGTYPGRWQAFLQALQSQFPTISQ